MVKRSPGIKLLFVALVAAILVLPLLMIYALVSEREVQNARAEASITAGWGGPQVISGPVLAIPYVREDTRTEVVDGRSVTRTQLVRDELFLSPQQQAVATQIEPTVRSRSIYRSVIYRATLEGRARFALPADLPRYGVTPDQLRLDQAELRFGISDPRGLQSDARVVANGAALPLQPGKGLASSGGAGFFAFLDWAGAAPLEVQWRYSARGSRSLSLVPRGGETRWEATSPWPSPSFGGSFLPETREVSAAGFTAAYSITNLALGQGLLLLEDPGPPLPTGPGMEYLDPAAQVASAGGPSMAASIELVEPVDHYSRVDRSVKYGFLFIGFTFLAYFMFDVVGGARVAAAEYFLTGAGLVLFFVLLLAFAEVIGFTPAYLVASAAIIGLLTAYSAAVLGTRRRAGFMAALLVALYALIYVLLSLDALSLMIGSVLLFLALAGVMYATRDIDWSRPTGGDGDGEAEAAG